MHFSPQLMLPPRSFLLQPNANSRKQEFSQLYKHSMQWNRRIVIVVQTFCVVDQAKSFYALEQEQSFYAVEQEWNRSNLTVRISYLLSFLEFCPFWRFFYLIKPKSNLILEKEFSKIFLKYSRLHTHHTYLYDYSLLPYLPLYSMLMYSELGSYQQL